MDDEWVPVGRYVCTETFCINACGNSYCVEKDTIWDMVSPNFTQVHAMLTNGKKTTLSPM